MIFGVVVVDWARSLARDLWVEATCACNDDGFGAEWGSRPNEVVYNLGCSTVIPSYSDYCEYWRIAGFDNPLEVDWVGKSVDGWLINKVYLHYVIETMSEQINFWRVDENSHNNPILYAVESYVEGLVTLYISLS
ncbi:MAG: hypothetical protein ACRCZI_12945 [Cetobacterium sp.]